MFKQKTFKYSLDMVINELSNIPQVGGGCFIELQIKDNKRHGGGLHVLKHHTTMNLSKTSQKKDKKDGEKEVNEDSVVSTSTSNSSGNVNLTTSTKRIHNFRCVFNYRISCNVKLTAKKGNEQLDNKYVIMTIYYVSNPSSKSGSGGSSTKMGVVELNLRDYVDVDNTIKSKFLLKESKINSILRLSIELTELPVNFDFRTQLQVSESGAGTGEVDKEATFAGSPTTTSFRFSNLDRKHNLSSTPEPTNGRHGNSSSSTVDSSDNFDRYNVKGRKQTLGSKRTISEFGGGQDGASQGVLVDPTITSLYRKVLESAWDADFHELLEYTPEQSVNDMFDNPARFEKHLSDLKSKSLEHEDLDDMKGLIEEMSYREDLKSWTVKAP